MSFRFPVVATTLAVASITIALGLANPREAHAFCRTTTSESFTPTAEKPCDDAGKPIIWPSKCVGWSMQQNASVQIDLPTARAAVKQALGNWSTADCSTCPGTPAGTPSITFDELATVSCGKAEYNPDAGNANVITFWDKDWPHPGGDVTLALTTVTFSVASGELLDADIEINSDPALNPLTVGDPTGKPIYDLLSILQHETGHFLGLAHSQPSNTDATMSARYRPGDSFMRTLAPDDVCGVCTIYPTGRVATCDDAPQGGFNGECGGGPARTSSSGCHCAFISGGPLGLGDVTAIFASLAITLGIVRRRRPSAKNT